MQRKGTFIKIDGITGSGKSTVLRAVMDWAEAQGHRVFRLSEWSDVTPPRFEEIADFDVYFTYEPTRTWIGRAIRYELSRTDLPYGGEELAHAFALDRQIMYQRLIIPALEAGKIIIQDRGVSTSVVYQPVMQRSIPLEFILDLPGNRLAFDHPPDALVITRVPAHVAHERICRRTDESKGVFSKLAFLKLQEERFQQPWFKELFESRGTTIHELDTSGALEESKQRARDLIERLLA